MRNGDLDMVRPDWGKRHSHPLYNTWQGMRRTEKDPVWDDFWVFVEDVGDRPSPRHLLKRHNAKEPFGPNNWYWAEPIKEDGIGNNSRAARAAYAKEWRKRNPLLAKESHLKKSYGITMAEYDAMLESQDGVCAICGAHDQHFSLAVDHNHKTTAVRGLLCTNCNKMLGHAHDNVDVLRKAIAYLERH